MSTHLVYLSRMWVDGWLGRVVGEEISVHTDLMGILHHNIHCTTHAPQTNTHHHHPLAPQHSNLQAPRRRVKQATATPRHQCAASLQELPPQAAPPAPAAPETTAVTARAPSPHHHELNRSWNATHTYAPSCNCKPPDPK